MEVKKMSLIIKAIKDASEKTQNTSKAENDIGNIISNIKRAFYQTDSKEFASKINKIKKTFIKNWETDNLPFIQSFVDKVDPSVGIPLPILAICGQGTQEIRFTKYLAYFLDSNKKHGLQDKLIQAILGPESKSLDLDPKWSQECTVIPEVKLGEIQGKGKPISCFADIGVEGEDYIIIVEQKILSSESKHPDSDLNQLARYNAALANNPDYRDKRHVKIYLTPKDSDKKEVHGWLPLTHKDLIDRGITLLKSNTLSKVGNENLSRLLIDLAVGPYELLEESLDELVLLGNKLVNEKLQVGNFVRFNKLMSENEKLIEILMEGY